MSALHTCMTRAEWVHKVLKDQRFINPEHDARDTRRKIAAYVRVAGITGVAPLSRYAYSVTGKATRSPNLEAVGLCPSKQSSVDPRDAGAQDMAKVSRYASHYKGERFATSMQRAKDASEHTPLTDAWLRAQFPWLPVDKAGSLMPGRVNKRGERYFDMQGTRYTSRELYAAWAANEGADTVAAQSARSAELKRLSDEQSSDMRAQRKGRAFG